MKSKVSSQPSVFPVTSRRVKDSVRFHIEWLPSRTIPICHSCGCYQSHRRWLCQFWRLSMHLVTRRLLNSWTDIHDWESGRSKVEISMCPLSTLSRTLAFSHLDCVVHDFELSDQEVNRQVWLGGRNHELDEWVWKCWWLYRRPCYWQIYRVCGIETWTLCLALESPLDAFCNRFLRQIGFHLAGFVSIGTLTLVICTVKDLFWILFFL